MIPLRMGDFDACIDYVLGHEGGYVNHPDDPGGETQWGISKRAFPHLEISALTRDQAITIYRCDYWLTVRADLFPAGLALLLFDSAVNNGTQTAVKLLQRALRVTEDGIPGPNTQTAAILRMPDALTDFAAERARYYALLPTVRAFGRGWYRRLFDLYGVAGEWHRRAS